MTTLTQSDLKDLRRNVEAALERGYWMVSEWMSPKDHLVLLDHIAQLADERDEARKRVQEVLSEKGVEIVIRDARIAALEAQLAEAVANEREACANIAASWGENYRTFKSVHALKDTCEGNTLEATSRDISTAIRTRSEQEGK